MGAAYFLVPYFIALIVFFLAGWIKHPHQALVVTLIFLAVAAVWGLLSESFSC